MSEPTTTDSGTPGVRPPRRAGWRGFARALLILVCGIVIGAAGALTLVHKAVQHARIHGFDLLKGHSLVRPRAVDQAHVA